MLQKITELYNAASWVPNPDNNKKFGKDLTTVINYINEHFYPMQNGNYYIKNVDCETNIVTYDCVDKTTLQTVYFNKLPAEVKDWFFNKNLKIYKPINSIHKPKITDTTFNFFEGYKHIKKNFNEYSPEIKSKVQLMNDFFLEIICSNNKEVFDHYIKWHATVAQGGFTKTVLYLKGPEGIGKSTVTKFFREWVFGEKITIKSDVTPLKTAYNKILLGKVYVVFEELPAFNQYEWQGVSSKIKDMSDSQLLLFSDKFEKSFEAVNFNNYVINTNMESIQHADGRRYFYLDVSTKREKDYDYFSKLNEACFNNEVGEAYYNYLLSIDTKGWIGQNFPDTNNKLTAIVELMCLEHKFLKYEYILKKKGLNRISPKKLYEEYQKYCSNQGKQAISFHKFPSKLKEVGIDYRASGGYNIYVLSWETLNEIAKKRKWIHELDEYDGEDQEECEMNELELIKIENAKLIKENQAMKVHFEVESDLQKQLREAQELIAKLQEQLNKPSKVVEVKVAPKPENEVKKIIVKKPVVKKPVVVEAKVAPKPDIEEQPIVKKPIVKKPVVKKVATTKPITKKPVSKPIAEKPVINKIEIQDLANSIIADLCN